MLHLPRDEIEHDVLREVLVQGGGHCGLIAMRVLQRSAVAARSVTAEFFVGTAENLARSRSRLTTIARIR